MEAKAQAILDEVETFSAIGEKTPQLLAVLNYHKEGVLETTAGTWEIFVKKDFVFPYFVRTVSTPVNKFVALLRSTKPFTIYGSYENINDLRQMMISFTASFLVPPRSFLGIPLTLTSKNGQDYGYSRGLIIGIGIMVLDIAYSMVFKTRSGMIFGLTEFINLVYYGNPNLAIYVGVFLSGLYFGTLLILLPIVYGNICISRGLGLPEKKLHSLPSDMSDFEYGSAVEKALEEEMNALVEERRKTEVFTEVSRMWPAMEKERFENLYQQVSTGFFPPEILLDFLVSARESDPAFDIEQFLGIILRFRKAGLRFDVVFDPPPGPDRNSTA